MDESSKSKFAEAFNTYFASGALLKHEPILHPLTLASVGLEMFFNETPLAKGTGFLWRVPQGMALTTAWHNFSGLHHTTRQCLSKTGGMPNRVRVKHMSMSPPKFLEQDLPLYLDDEFEEPRWFVHGLCGNYFDIAHLLLQIPKDIEFACANDTASLFAGYLHPGSNLVAVGFPQGVNSIGVLPIWKQGALASEFALPTEGHPKFLIDIAGRGGLSGAPVYRMQHGTVVNESPTGQFLSAGFGNKMEFLGLYSGRIGDQGQIDGPKESSDLGFVWRSGIVVEALNSGVLDERPEVGKGVVTMTPTWKSETSAS